MVEGVFRMLKRICNYSGCDCFSEPGHIYCAKHLLESQKKHEEYLEKNHKKKPFENAIRCNDYNNAEWRALRKEVLKRDNYCCQQCGASQKECEFPLEIHHIIPPKGNKDLFLDANNCITLCKVCHARITQEEVRENKLSGY